MTTSSPGTPPGTGPTTSAPALPAQYVPGEGEREAYERWVDSGAFTPPAEGQRPPFAIVIPPPNVTGSLHLGHAFDHTLIDTLVRRRRMQGYDALWLPGMDHAGIATQNVVERELAKEGLSRHDLGREAFVERVWDWKQDYGGRILGQMRRLGDSVDWSRERFTMDAGLSRAVQTMFKRLFDDDLIYRAERIINWCPRCHTALSDIEVEHQDDEGELVSIRYGDGDDSVVVATTRVETMLGDTGVAVHPDDERYTHLVGRTVRLPLVDRDIAVVADDHVDPAFGTGAVKVTPAHDPNDFEIGRRHGLAMPTVMDESAVITVPGPWHGLDRLEARASITQALREEGRIVSERRPYTHAVGHCSRCGTVVEPRLSLQWFVSVGPLAKAAGDAVRDGRIRIHPREMEARWFAWVDDMHDWCISRQLWWGHRIPVWYGPDGEVVCVGPDEEPPSGPGWHQDDDVLDTWFSSGQWPFSTLGWPDDTADLRRFYPTSVLVTGYDILFFWVARMAMFGLYVMDGRPPFDVVVLHGMVRDQLGRKMSKSAGNGVDPIEWIDTYGSDALRFTLARGANPGVDVPIGEEWVQGSRNFANKLWNATRFAVMNGADAAADLPPAERLAPAERWILSRLHTTLAEVDALFEDFQFAKVADLLYHFAWDELCDWYLELAKVTLRSAGEQEAADVRAVLGHCFDTLLRVLHPMMPFVTERLWGALTGRDVLATAQWPGPRSDRIDLGAEREVADLQRLVGELRQFRADQGLKPGQRVPGALAVAPEGVHARYAAQVGELAGLRPVEVVATVPDGWTVLDVAAGTSVALDLSGAIDVGAERARLGRALGAARKERAGAQAKLGNEQFLARAPEAVVATIRGRLLAAEEDLERLGRQLDALPPA